MAPHKKPAPPALADALTDEVRAERLDTLSGPDSPEGRALGAAIGSNVGRYRAERRSGDDRRQKRDDLVERIGSATDRRAGAERRSGADRRHAA